MSDRFFASSPVEQNVATLTGPEAHHLAHVMCAQVGQHVTLFDGTGSEFVAEIQAIKKSGVELRIVERRQINRESPVKLTLAVALPKGDRQRRLIEKAVELGVANLIPLQTQRGVAQPSNSALDRLRRAVVEASKQCGRNRLMEISHAQTWMELISAPRPGELRLLAHPGGTPLRQVWQSDFTTQHADGIVAAIGPEGGFTPEEVTAATTAGWQLLDLGPRILRVETAAVALAAWATLCG